MNKCWMDNTEQVTQSHSSDPVNFFSPAPRPATAPLCPNQGKSRQTRWESFGRNQ